MIAGIIIRNHYFSNYRNSFEHILDLSYHGKFRKLSQAKIKFSEDILCMVSEMENWAYCFKIHKGCKLENSQTFQR